MFLLFILFCSILFYSILFYFILFNLYSIFNILLFILFYSVLFYFILLYFILFNMYFIFNILLFILFYFILSKQLNRWAEYYIDIASHFSGYSLNCNYWNHALRNISLRFSFLLENFFQIPKFLFHLRRL